jgi:D-alanyl-D-alanine carboxypeptidase
LFKHRVIAFVVMVVLAVVCAAPDAEAKKRTKKRKPSQTQSRQVSGTNDARYAALIMNPVTGEIYHQHDAAERRYPASLTKMMTLYLLFEAIEQKKFSLDDELEVSALAARQPQTNLSLDDGDEIEVETAIKALVVRSANDVSVVVAEALAGDVDSFAKKMTAKAKSLGMTDTIFKNPNGLPNSGQVTSARDMAKLGIALKRDFPRYYRYFSTLQFSHAGVTYYTHNRVMLRYAGVDGIKTGYIGASGFNLVTSVTRGGRPLMGVVMGGASGRWRDDRMIQLLDATYDTIAKRGAAKGRYFPANLPLSRAGKSAGAAPASADDPSTPTTALPAAVPESSEGEDAANLNELPAATLPVAREEVRASTQQVVAPQAAPAPRPTGDSISRAPIMVQVPSQPVVQTPSQSRVITVSPPAASPSPAPTPSPFDMARPPTPAESSVIQPPALAPMPQAAPAQATPPETSAQPVDADGRAWGIQVGAFSTQALAVAAARNALQIAPKPLVAAKLPLADVGGGTNPVHRARLENLTQLEARKACENLIAQNSPCFIYRAAQ